MYKQMKDALANELKSVDCVSLTTDLWTSSNKTSFMVVSCHFIDSNWTLHKQLILFKELPSPHTGPAIAYQLISTIVNWKIIDKVAFITLDNASSNDAAMT